MHRIERCLRAAFIHRILTGIFIGPRDKYNIRAVPMLFSILFVYILYLHTFGTETPFAYFPRIAYRGQSASFNVPSSFTATALMSL
jgi:hypothetical protein